MAYQDTMLSGNYVVYLMQDHSKILQGKFVLSKIEMFWLDYTTIIHQLQISGLLELQKRRYLVLNLVQHLLVLLKNSLVDQEMVIDSFTRDQAFLQDPNYEKSRRLHLAGFFVII